MASRPLLPLSILGAALAALSYVATVVSHETLDVVRSGEWLPRWDLAAHVVNGWTDYFYLKTLQIHRLLWDLWMQGYWPPVHSIYQMPFYLVLGGGMRSGLISSLAAFVLTGLGGVTILYVQWRRTSLLPAALFLLFIVSSPFYLAYASVAMTELLAALAHVSVLLAYLYYERARTERAARLFAISLTLLFFTKYNYFILLAVPLVLHEWLRRTAASTAADRARRLWEWTRVRLFTPIGATIAIYVVAVLAITLSGGFEFHLFGRRVAMHSVGNAGYPLLYFLLARVWYLHRRGRIDWTRLFSLDPRVRPLLLWLALPVVIWLASPFPNHIKDIANLLINRPTGEPAMGIGMTTYLRALEDAYFYSGWLLALALAGFGVAALRYRTQSPFVQWMILAAPIEFAMVAFHPTQVVRFLLVTLLPLWLVACGEAGHWISVSRGRRLVAAFASPLVLAYALVSAREIVRTDRFRSIAFNNYVHSAPLAEAFAAIRADVGPDDRLAVQGQSEEISPGLLKWMLGPPSGLVDFPAVVTPDTFGQLDEATRVVLVAPTNSELAPQEISSRYPIHAAALQSRVDRGEFRFEREIAADDLHVSFRVYRRP